MLGRLHYYQTTTMPIACKWHCTSRGLPPWPAAGSFWQGFASGTVAYLIASCTGDLVDKLPAGWKKDSK
jgi:hypothetical protein